ncbi:MAG: 2,3-epoxybenzoyl-CoA dihydrolase, partial [Gammaproteobacteria bacterium]
VKQRALELAALSDRPDDAQGVALTPLERSESAAGLDYRTVSITIDRGRRLAELTVRAPETTQPNDLAGILQAGVNWWPLRLARELDDAILHLRTNELEIGTWLLRAAGDPERVLACDAALDAHQNHWFVRETRGFLRRCLARLDVSSRTLFALIERGSCFVGTLLEIALASDRCYIQALPEDAPSLQVSMLNFGAYPMVNGKARLAQRFYDDAAAIGAVRVTLGRPIDPQRAVALGLVTGAPDDLDWDDEIRLLLEERASLSPDALTGLEANLRFGVDETLETRIFGRLSAWQNWIFSRPNAVGDKGALKVYGKGEKAAFDYRRI